MRRKLLRKHEKWKEIIKKRLYFDESVRKINGKLEINQNNPEAELKRNVKQKENSFDVSGEFNL